MGAKMSALHEKAHGFFWVLMVHAWDDADDVVEASAVVH